jgi:predicted lactoylglutathione lyase
MIVTLQVERREEVDELLARALAAGAAEQRPPLDQGFTRSRAFADLDGHIWEVFWMNLDVLL